MSPLAGEAGGERLSQVESDGLPNLAAVKEEYADDARLGVRYLTHQRYTLDPVDFVQWTLARVPWRGDERVLDVGCGPGDLLRAMACRSGRWGLLAGCDFSPGMARRAAELSPELALHFFAADAQWLPVPDASFDVVLARHMLYYVPDIDRAVAETARVLVPGGRLVTTTNSATTMAELWDYCQQVAAHFPGLLVPAQMPERFSLENAPGFLACHLDGVETYVLRGTLRFPEAQPFLDYYASARAEMAVPGHSDAEWQAALHWLAAQVQAHIDRHGHLDVTKIAGAVAGVKRA